MIENRPSIFQRFGEAVNKTLKGTLVEGTVAQVLREDEDFWRVIVETNDGRVVEVKLPEKGKYVMSAESLTQNLPTVPHGKTLSFMYMPYKRGFIISMMAKNVKPLSDT